MHIIHYHNSLTLLCSHSLNKSKNEHMFPMQHCIRLLGCIICFILREETPPPLPHIATAACCWSQRMSLFTCCIRKAPYVKILDYRHSGLNQVPSAVFNAERTIETLHIDANQIKALPRVCTFLFVICVKLMYCPSCSVR